VRSSPTAPGKSESADHDRLAMLANFPQQGHNPSVTKLTSRFDGAVAFASRVHGEQMRKGSKTPYISHLLAVASLVIEYGGSEDAAIAGLLHDCIEDCGAGLQDPVRERFGEEVLRIVLGCSDSVLPAGNEKAEWQSRKR
jgi:(p)ppGpp synthase/HD superfamily hydrolase